MASLFASQRLCNPAAVNCRDVKAVFHIAQRPLPPAASATCSSNSRDSRTAAGDRIAWGAAGCKQTVRGQSQVAYGASKTSLYTQLPDRLDEPTPGFDSIADALEDLAAGKFVVVLDDEDRENEGDLIINADKVTTEAMAFMVEHTSGVVCISMEGSDLDRLQLPQMITSAENDESMYTAFAVTVDLRAGTSTGISAADRAATIRALADPLSTAADFRRPGHIFPLRYRQGGVITRPGHTEAAVDLARLSGSTPAGVLCEIVNRADGSMARTPQLLAFAKEHGLKCITIADMIRYRLRHEQLLQQVASAQLDTRYGTFKALCFRSLVDGAEHVALVAGDASALQQQQQQGVLARVQQQRRLIDVFGSLHCGQGPFLDQALQAIAAEGTGVVLYVAAHQADGTCSSSLAGELQEYAASQEECSIISIISSGSSSSSSSDGWVNSNRAGPSSSLSPDLRDTAAAAHMLRHLGVTSVRLMSNDDSEAQRLRCCGVQVEVVGLPTGGSNGSSGGSSLLQQQQQQQLQAMLGHLGNGSSTAAAANGAVGAGL